MSNTIEIEEPIEGLLASLPENVQSQILATINNDINLILEDDPTTEIPGYAPGVRIQQGVWRDGPSIWDLTHYSEFYGWMTDEEVLAIRKEEGSIPLITPVRISPSPLSLRPIDVQGDHAIIDNTHLIPSLTEPINTVYRYINESVYFSFNPKGSPDQIDYSNRPIITAYTNEGTSILVGEPQIREELTHWILSGNPLNPGGLRALAKNVLNTCGYRLQCTGCEAQFLSFFELRDHMDIHFQ